MTHSHKVQHFKDTAKVTVSLNMHAGNLETSGRQLLIYQDTELCRPMHTEWCCYLHVLVHYKFNSAITDTKYRLKHTFHFQLLLPSSTPVPNHLSALHFPGMLCSIDCQSFIDISWQYIGPIFKVQAVQ